MNATVLIPLAVALVGALGAYLAAARRFGGRIGTSDAAQLWKESRAMREDYREQLLDLRRALSECEGRVGALERRNDDLLRENGRLQRMVEELRAGIAVCEETCERLRAQVAALLRENQGLREAGTR